MGEDGLIGAWAAYCHRCKVRAVVALPGVAVSKFLAIRWLAEAGWAKDAEGHLLCPKCAKKG